MGIAAEWGMSENNRRARFYRLDGCGGASESWLRRRASWERLTQAVFSMGCLEF